MAVALQAQPAIAFDDPLLSKEEFPYSARFFPLGFPVVIRTNSGDVIDAASASWSYFDQTFDVEPVAFSIGVTEGLQPVVPPPPVFRSREHLFSIVSDGDNFFTCDFSRGYQFGWISVAVAKASDFFRYYFLDVAALTMLQQKYLAPIHGACVERAGSGIVLCGLSSAGKSTLAYACGRDGWTYVSDDATFLMRNSSARHAIGNSHTIRLREDAPLLFPELARCDTTLRANGTSRIEVRTRDLQLSTANSCSIEQIVFLDRHSAGPARLERFSKSKALEWFASFTTYGEREVREAQMESYRRLLDVDVWALHYENLDDALTLLNRLLPDC